MITERLKGYLSFKASNKKGKRNADNVKKSLII